MLLSHPIAKTTYVIMRNEIHDNPENLALL